ncbi:MAG TPA: tandem-95 repeat protein, partial [Crenotrichaceae bacterium]|nr:tandem-95 repeat protein [Crenotrichaceae bacterium]
TFLIQADGSYTYTAPSVLTNNLQEVFSYRIADNSGTSSDSTLTVSVSPGIQANRPLAQDDTAAATAGGDAVSGNVLSNDTLGSQPTTATPVSIALTASGGSFNLLADGNYTYTPPENLQTTAQEQFPYTITDTRGQTSSATLTVTVSPAPPAIIKLQARPDSNTAFAGGEPVSGNVLDNDEVNNQLVRAFLSSQSRLPKGVIQFNTNGSYTYTPPITTRTTFTDQFRYFIADNDGNISSSFLNITVNRPELVPFARADVDETTASGAAIAGNVLSNDDLGNQPTNVTPIQTNSTTALGGIFSLLRDGSYTYMPPQSLDTVEQEIFDYSITDIDQQTSASTLTITVNPEDQQPLAVADTDTAIAGGSAVIGNVLGNDVLGNQPTIVSNTVMNLQTQSGGLFSLAVDGAYSYLPQQDLAEPIDEVFNYTITDKDGDESSTTLTITVDPTPLTPVCRADNETVTAADDVTTGNVLANDQLGNEPSLVTPVAVSRTQNGGSLNLLADGNYTYTPPTSVDGTVVDTFTYILTDNDGQTCDSTLTITISPLILTPLARPDTDSVTLGGASLSVPVAEVAAGNVLINDDLGAEPTTVTPIVIDSTEIGGSFILRANGSYNYSPPVILSRPGVATELFTYTITDSNNKTSRSTLTIKVEPRNLVPLARPDTNTVTALPNSHGATGNVLDNDDLGNQRTRVTPIVNITTLQQGFLNLLSNGEYTYLPPSAIKGVVTDRVSYTITDRDGETSRSTLTITVNPNLTPEAVLDTNTARAGGSQVTGNVLKNDILGNPDTLATPLTVATTPNGGSLNLLENGNYTYTPPKSVTSEVTDAFNYTITDDDGGTSSSTLRITVFPQLRANADNSQVKAGSNGFASVTIIRHVVTGNLLDNDLLGATPTTVLNPVTDQTTQLGGLFTIASDGSYTYTAPVSRTTTAQEQISYTIQDNQGETSTAVLTIIVTPDLQAIDDTNKITAGTSSSGFSLSGFLSVPNTVTGNVLTNDRLGTQPTTVTPIPLSRNDNGGFFVLNADGSYSYSAAFVEIREDIFTYTISDSDGDTSRATLRVTVTPELRALPDAGTRSIISGAATNISGNALANDKLGNTPTQATAFTEIRNGGVFTLSSNGGYTFNTANFTHSSGVRQGDPEDLVFNYTITDSDGNTSSSTITITITVITIG